MERPFHSRLEDLPQLLPVFPLPGVLLLPEGRLPLNIFEPRYLAMVQDALGWGRLIGMIQPSGPAEPGCEPPLFDVGCAGRISAFSETEDGRILLTLTGVCRFKLARELDGVRGYRRVSPDWQPYRADLDEPQDPKLTTERLLAALRPYLRLKNIDLNWKTLQGASPLVLSVSLPMALPFEAREKQALLEAPDIDTRAETLLALLEMAVAEGSGLQSTSQQ